MACEMHGGDEPVCMPQGALRLFEKKHERPCPYVALDPRNVLAAELIQFGLSEPLRPFAPMLFELSTGHLSETERRSTIMRLARVLGDADVLDALYPHRKAARKAATTGSSRARPAPRARTMPPRSLRRR